MRLQGKNGLLWMLFWAGQVFFYLEAGKEVKAETAPQQRQVEHCKHSKYAHSFPPSSVMLFRADHVRVVFPGWLLRVNSRQSCAGELRSTR